LDNFIAEFSNHLLSVAKKNLVFVGLSEAEIENLKVAQGVHFLPKIYLDYLRLMGKDNGGVLFRDGGVVNKTSAKDSLSRNISSNNYKIVLPANAFVFYNYIGENFLFFLCSENDDPAVFLFYEGFDQFFKMSASLSHWFFEQSLNPLDFNINATPYSGEYVDGEDLPF
jgi:hypothetical protein